MHTISVGGHDRTYRLYKPTGLPASAPLVVMLHGGFGSGAQAEKSYGWDELADSSKFVVAYPDGLNRAWNVNGGGCCGRPAKEGIDDVGFITAAVADIGQQRQHRRRPRLRHRHQQRRHHVLHAGVRDGASSPRSARMSATQLNSCRRRIRRRSCTSTAPPIG